MQQLELAIEVLEWRSEQASVAIDGWCTNRQDANFSFH